MTSLVDDNDRGEAGQHDTYGFALDRRNRTSRRGDQISARAPRPICAAACPQPEFPAAPVPVHLLRDREQRPLFHNRYQPDRASRTTTAGPPPTPPTTTTTTQRERVNPA